MKILIHSKAKSIVKVLSMDNNQVSVKSSQCTEVLWELAERFPDEIIGWCEADFENKISLENWDGIFKHQLIMASYAVNSTFLPGSIGYVDQLPFVNVNRNVLFGTWQMSSDVGGIRGEVLKKFEKTHCKVMDLNYLLNSIAKLGQQKGLFCYSAPDLVLCNSGLLIQSASKSQLFKFVYQHYKTLWCSILLLSLFYYKNQLPLWPYLTAFGKKKMINISIDLTDIKIIEKHKISPDTIDVVIPTMGRPAHLLQVVKDLAAQQLLPKNVIIVEQDPDPRSVTALRVLSEEKWPFRIIHHFIHQTGACNARNLALKEVTSNWVFFCDDDNRIEDHVLTSALKEMNRYGALGLNTAYRQKDEQMIFHFVKQWGTFGSGNGFVSTEMVKKVAFSPIFEHGYGEDADFGMQLRNVGCDIIYHPDIEIEHLKAPMGGFRQKPRLDWEKEIPLPKPSPTVMALALRYYTPEQLKGFKISVFLKYYRKQLIKNPLTYYKIMSRRWTISEEWAAKLQKDYNNSESLTPS